MRKIPDVTPPDSITPRKIEIEQKRTYELITPLYGGGVRSSEADPITVVRATEIRGLLRFWWRVLRGGQLEGDLSTQERENAIWGKAYEKGEASIPSDQIIQLVVDIVKEGTPVKPFEMRGQRPIAINDIPGYVAFPLQPPQGVRIIGNPPIPTVRQGVQFSLTITYPAHLSKEIEAALWAWETFGGLGARTRRGFGALHLLAIDDKPYQLLPTPREAERWIREQANEHSRGGNFPPGVPHLNSTLQLVLTPPSANSMLAWNRLIRKLQNFRQQKNANNRSAWPEADAIRAVAGRGPIPQIQKFPRAALGLPIIFHFTGNNAPGDYTLNEANRTDQTLANNEPTNPQPPNKQRLASPIILRPFLCSDRQAVGIALLLEGSRADLKNLVLQDKDDNVQEVSGTSTLNGTLSPGEARAIAQRSSDGQDAMGTLRTLQSETDVLQAFLKSVKGV